MAVDRRAKPYYYLSSVDVEDGDDDDLTEANNDSREGVARFLVSFLCKSRGRNSVEKILSNDLLPLKSQELSTAEALKKFCQAFPQCFVVRQAADGSEEDEMIEVTTDVNLCSAHLKKKASCPEDGECGYLHLCRFFMLNGQCDCGTPKQVMRLYGHQLSSDHNQTVLKHHLMEHLTLRKVRILVQRLNARREQTRPMVCGFYNKHTGCFKGDRCGLLHLCRRFVFGDCKFGAECIRCHDLDSANVVEILKRYKIPVEQFHTVMMAPPHPVSSLLPSPYTMTSSSSSDVHNTGIFPPQQTSGSGGVVRLGDSSALQYGEVDDVRGGLWGSPFLKTGGQSGRGAAVTGGVEDSPSAPSTIFSRRRGHMMDSAGSQGAQGWGQGADKEEDRLPVPTSMNPFSYMRVGEQSWPDGSGCTPATRSREESQSCGHPLAVSVASLDIPKADSPAIPFSRKAEDIMFGRSQSQSQDSNFIPLKQVDKPLSARLTPGRPVASVPPQMKIKPELGICRNLDMTKSSEHVQFGAKKSEDSDIVQKAWNTKNVASASLGVASSASLGVSSSDGKVPTSTQLSAPAATSQNTGSLHNIISSLIDNVKKLHAKNPGPEQHLMKYLSELAQPDKLHQEMEAADREREEEESRAVLSRNSEDVRTAHSRNSEDVRTAHSRNSEDMRTAHSRGQDRNIAHSNSQEKDRLGQAGERYRSDGEISDSDDEETGKGRVSTHKPAVAAQQEKVLIDYNHRPTVDLIGYMLRESSSPFEESPSYPPVPEPHPVRRNSATSHTGQGAGSQYELEVNREADQALEEISSANSALSDIMSSEDDSGDTKKRKRSRTGTKTSKPGKTAYRQEEQKTQDEKPESSCHQKQQVSTTKSSERKTVERKKASPETAPEKSCGTDNTGTTETTPGEKSLDNAAGVSDKSGGAELPVGPNSSADCRSLGQDSPTHRLMSPDRKSDPGKSSSAVGTMVPARRSLNCRSASGSKRSPPGARKPTPGDGKSAARQSSPGNRTATHGNSTADKKSQPSGNRESSDNRKPPANKKPLGTEKPTEEKKGSRLEKKKAEDSRRVPSGTRSAATKRRSSPKDSKKAASDGKKPGPEGDRRRPSSPLRKPSSHQHRPSSPGNNQPGPRGRESSDHQHYRPGIRKNSRSPDRRRSPDHHRNRHRSPLRTNPFDKEQPSRRQSPFVVSSGRGRHGASSSHRNRPAGLDWDERERTEKDNRFRMREKESFERDADDHHKFRGNRETMRMEGRDDRGRFRSRSHERRRSFEMNHLDKFFEDSSLERQPYGEGWLHSPSRERNWSRSPQRDRNQTQSPSRDRLRSGSGERRWGAGRRSQSPSQPRHSVSVTGDRQWGEAGQGSGHRGWWSRGRGHRAGDDRWMPEEEDGFFRSLDSHVPGEEGFHGDRFSDTSLRLQSPAHGELHRGAEEELHRESSRAFDDRSPGRTRGSKEDRFRNRLGPSPDRFESQEVEGFLLENYREIGWRGGRRGQRRRPPFGDGHFMFGEGCDDSVEGSRHREEGMHQPGFEGQAREDWHGDSTPSQRRMFSRPHKFASYEEWNNSGATGSMNSPLTERQVVLKYSSMSETDEERPGPPSAYRDQQHPDNMTSRASSHHRHRRSPSPSRVVRHSDEQDRNRDRSGPGDRSSQSHDFHEDSRQAKDRLGPESGEGVSSLRDRIDDLLDKVRHSGSRGASPFQGVEEGETPEDAAQTEGVDLRGPSHSHDAHRRDHSHHRRQDGHGSGRPSKRHREGHWTEPTIEAKKIRQDGRGRGCHSSGEQESWDMTSPGRDPDSTDNFESSLERENRHFSASVSRRRGNRGRGSFRPYFRGRGRGRGRGLRGNDAREGLRIKRVFNIRNQNPLDYQDLGPYQDLDQPGEDNGEDSAEDAPLGPGPFYEGDPFTEDLEEDGGGEEVQGGDVGDMIRRQRARVMRLDLRNVLKMRKNSWQYQEAESKQIQISVRRGKEREQHISDLRDSLRDDQGRQVIVAPDQH